MQTVLQSLVSSRSLGEVVVFCKNSGTFFPVVNSVRVSRKNFNAITGGCLHVAMEDISAGLTESPRTCLTKHHTAVLFQPVVLEVAFPFSIFSIGCFFRNAEPHRSRLGESPGSTVQVLHWSLPSSFGSRIFLLLTND